MARNGSGTYSRTQSDYAFNTVIQEEQINSELNDIATELTASLEASGKKTWTGNQNAGSTKVTALAVGTANADSTTLGQVQNSGMQYATGSGTNTIVATMAPAITAYVAGQTFRIKMAAGANTGATTLNLNSVAAKNITKKGTTALAAGDIPANAMFEVAYDGTQFQLLNVGTDVGITASESVALTNKTVDLGSNTVTGSLAEFNTALQSESFCSLAGSETLTNKTLTSAILNSPTINDPAFDVSVGNTANTGSVQGNNAITSFLYEIATCANEGDAVTLPAAAAGLMVVVVNNGAESADVFPASGDKIDGASANVAYALASATNTIFICQDATDWDTVSGGGGGTSNMVVDTMTGDNSDTTLTLSQDPGSENNVTVTLDGVTQHHDTFSVSGTTLTFSTAPATGVAVEAVSGAASTIGVPDDGSVATAKIAANAVDETKLKDALVADFTEVVVTASDSLLLGDATDSGNTKRDTVQGILDLASHTGNVQFPASQSASADVNNLDDYQEGTWTPVITATTNNHTYSAQHGNYVKIGKHVHCHALVTINAVNSTSGNCRFGGLPFTASATAGNYGLMFVSNFSSLNITAGYNMFGRVDLNETSGGFSIHDSGTSATSIQFSELSADATVYLSIQYYV
jgi:hypothetical protein